METNSPLYVLRFNEAVRVPDNGSGKTSKLKVAVLVIVAIIAIASLVFQDNIFMELSWPARLMLISLCIGSFFAGGQKKVPSEMEIQFYEDYLIVFKSKHYYTRRISRREYDKFKYNDIKEIQFRTATKRINIFGIVEGTWYDYQKDGSLPAEPTYHKVTDSICYFYTDFAPDIDFVSEFESHCPVKVTVDQT